MHAPEQDQPVIFPNGAAVYTRGPVDAHAWPGGYPLAYYPVDEHGSTVGDILCPDCATKELADLADPDMSPHLSAGVIANVEEEVHSTIWCDGCSRPFIFQNWCHFCQESVDVDEDHPHVCRPLKWQVTYTYRSNNHDGLSYDRFATRQAARDRAATLKRSGYFMAHVSPIVPPIVPES